MFGIGKSQRHVVIIGNGIAGITTARHLRKRDRKVRITVISGEAAYFWSRPALMYIYMGHMRLKDTQPYAARFFRKSCIELVHGWVVGVDTANKKVELEKGDAIDYDQLVVATGSQPNKFGWPGQDLDRVHGMYTLGDMHALESITGDLERGVVVGGGLIGVELAEMLHSRGKEVTLLAREEGYWDNALPREEATLVGRVIREAGVDLRLETELEEIVADGQGRAHAVRSKSGDTVDCQFVGLTAGVRPNLSAIEGADIDTGRGVLCDFSFRTHTEDVFACGDCAEIETPEGERNRIEQLWYTGEMHGEVLGAVLAGEEASYERGIWFNSAKFFDLEWHTYGQVPPALAPQKEGRVQAYWEHPTEAKCFRLVFDDGALVGVNAMGIRYRHRVSERWIAEGRDPDHVLERLAEGDFEPEFFRRHYDAIRSSMREQLR